MHKFKNVNMHDKLQITSATCCLCKEDKSQQTLKTMICPLHSMQLQNEVKSNPNTLAVKQVCSTQEVHCEKKVKWL